MRKTLIGIVAAAVLVSAGPVFATQGAAQDTIFDEVGDWFATVGRPGAKKDAILIQRRAERLAKRAQRAAKHAAEQADAAGKDLQKGLQGLGH